MKDQSIMVYARLVASMSHDLMLGKGPTYQAYVSNLRRIADEIPKRCFDYVTEDEDANVKGGA